MISVNKIDNRITFKIKTEYYLKLLKTETMKLLAGCYLKLLNTGTIKLLGSNKSKISKDENIENGPILESTLVVLVHCNINNKNNYKQDSRVSFSSIPNQ